ncbi:MAG: hypothetical protein SGPRY_001302 [Prymnesium sp.]
MGATPSLPLGEASSHVEAHLLGTRALSPSLRGTALLPIRKLLRSGAVSANTEKAVRSERRRQREADGESPGASCELLSSLLLLDPALERARYRCVPSVANESVWWTTYLHCLNEETLLHLPSLCREQEAADALSRASRALPAGAGAMVSLELNALLHLAAALPDVRSLLSLAATCRSMYPLAHHPYPWKSAFRRDFPEVAATLESSREANRQQYLKILYRSGAWIRVRAEFEYGYDNGDTVWGGRVAEEMIVRVDPEKREWSDPQPLHGEYRSLIQLQGDLEEAHEPPVASSRSTSKEVELSRMNLVCDAV